MGNRKEDMEIVSYVRRKKINDLITFKWGEPDNYYPEIQKEF